MTTVETPPITDRQRAVYEWVVEYCETRGYSPTIRELGNAFGIKSPNGVMCHIKPLAKKGFLRWTPHRSRTIRPIGGVK